MKFYYTYILYSKKDKQLYSGYTANLVNRFDEHQKGKNLSTKHRRPLELIYYEACKDEDDAKQRERYFKSGKGKKFVAKRLKRFMKRSGYGPATGSP